MFSEENKSDKPADLNKEELLKVLLHHYQSMTGAWFINKSCYILSYQETKDYEFFVGELNKLAQKEKIAPLKHLYVMQKNGELVSQQETYKSCGKESIRIVRGNFEITKRLYNDMKSSI